MKTLTNLLLCAIKGLAVSFFGALSAQAADAPTTQPDSKAPSHEHPTSGQLAFPGAEGYGRFAKGGRGGRIYEITTLEDYKSGKDAATSEPVIHGSLREAVEAEGPRTI